MRKFYLTVLCICAVLPLPLIGADPDFQAWKWKRNIETHGSKGFVRVPLSPEIFDSSQLCLTDLRVVNQSGALVPHLLEWERAAKGPQPEWKSARLLNRSQVDKKYSRVVADFGRIEEKNTLKVSVSGANFRRTVGIEGSNDSIRWEKLGHVFLLFDVTIQGRQQRVDVLRLPPNNYRFLRITVYNMPDEQEPIAIEAVKCATRKAITDKDLIPVPLKDLSIAQDKNSGQTVIRIDLGFKNLPINRIRIRVEDAYFHRGFSVSGKNSQDRDQRNHGKTFRTKAEQTDSVTYASSGVLYRVKDKEGSHEHLTLDDVNACYRFLELRIYNGDNPPLKVTTLEVWRGRADLIFEARPGTSYMLLGGNPAALTPNYDFARSVRDLDKDRLPVVEMGPAAKGPEQRSPWSERHGTLILTVLVALAIAIGFFILNSMKNLSKEG